MTMTTTTEKTKLKKRNKNKEKASALFQCLSFFFFFEFLKKCEGGRGRRKVDSGFTILPFSLVVSFHYLVSFSFILRCHARRRRRRERRREGALFVVDRDAEGC